MKKIMILVAAFNLFLLCSTVMAEHLKLTIESYPPATLPTVSKIIDVQDTNDQLGISGLAAQFSLSAEGWNLQNLGGVLVYFNQPGGVYRTDIIDPTNSMGYIFGYDLNAEAIQYSSSRSLIFHTDQWVERLAHQFGETINNYGVISGLMGGIWFQCPVTNWGRFYVESLGSITGTIKDSISGDLIAGASISGSFGNATSNQFGKYYIYDLLPGTYNLTVSAPKYLTLTKTDINVSPSVQTTLDISISLNPNTTGTLNGQVLNSEGLTSISNVTVKVTKGTDSFTKSTDTNGIFTFNDLTAGDYLVELVSTYYWSNQHSATINIDETTQLTITGIPQVIVGDIRNGWFNQDQLNQAVSDANAAKDLVIASMFTKAQLDQAVAEERIKWDINNDGKMGLEEVIYILQKMAGVR